MTIFLDAKLNESKMNGIAHVREVFDCESVPTRWRCKSGRRTVCVPTMANGQGHFQLKRRGVARRVHIQLARNPAALRMELMVISLWDLPLQ